MSYSNLFFVFGADTIIYAQLKEVSSFHARVNTDENPMHVVKHKPSGYVAGQSILDFYANNERSDTSNITGVLSRFHR